MYLIYHLVEATIKIQGPNINALIKGIILILSYY